MINRILFIISTIFIFSNVSGQVPKHIKWNVSTKTVSEKEAEVIYKATLDQHWHIWSVNPGDEMLIPPSFTFENSDIKKIGNPKEIGKKTTKKEEGYDAPLNYFEGTVQFIQKINFKKEGKYKTSVEYQICDENSCLPPTYEDFEVQINAFDAEKKDSIVESQTIVTETNFADSISNESTTQNTENITTDDGIYGKFGKLLNDCSSKTEELNAFTAFIAGILGGFLALFFPCTFPMIPMTMSFFLKGNQKDKGKGTRNAIFYGFAIFLVYFLLSVPFAFFGASSQALNAFSTNIWVNIGFFVVFIFFAFSLFGYYDISLPSRLTNKLDQKSDTGSFIGIFFMALTLAIVSFSCTGPILGLVLGNVKNVGLIMPAFSGFGLGLGIPFALFALFPKLLTSLPKSGSWLDVVKVVFGFIELAFAFKFLSNADLVGQWGILKREVFVAIWIIISIVSAMYLMGWFKFKKGATFKKTITTYILALLFALFSGYLATDYFGGELKEISGFPPPKSWSLFHQPEKFEIIHNDYEKALAKAKAENKPLMIDFTGWACVNCRRMEENIWVKPEIYDLMKDKIVIVSLYVDEKTELPKEEQRFSKITNKQIVTVGDKWFEFEQEHFHEATQPVYVLIHPHKEQIINKPHSGYNADSKPFLDFLKCGIDAVQNIK
jgi:thiol:disulfide interchange protein DsbD